MEERCAEGSVELENVVQHLSGLNSNDTELGRFNFALLQTRWIIPSFMHGLISPWTKEVMDNKVSSSSTFSTSFQACKYFSRVNVAQFDGIAAVEHVCNR